MRSDLIKVLHPILGIPMVMWPINAAKAAGLQPCLVVGHQEDRVRETLKNDGVLFARQAIPRGTGDAVLCAFEALPQSGSVLVCCGDTPLLRAHLATPELVHKAIESNLHAKKHWAALPWSERASIFLRAAELLAGPWRDRINATTMLCQAKTCYQAEIDAACELIDFWKFNVHYLE